ncbi:putative deoxyribonuclease TATDN1 [Echinococcus granulosus]|uniref:Deoxyribonuclease TATDN1 n=1 Tax=Echinococcus granulosus TaxID=6210 RepID=A0A068WJ60_ECHGR|nr:putative deoxyribonuclease TATDN1 [Echinococcus granulosus]CDS17654.1 deoxyribonuclease TATDN1 [Echinococcus granulosus]
MRKFIDIGANLTDSMFSGIYNGSQKHAPDLDQVLSRAFSLGMEKIIVTAGCRGDIVGAKALCCTDPRLYYTVGCHPTRCQEFAADFDQYYQELKNRVFEAGSRVVAIGECGLDYDRVHFCPKDIQLPCFRKQLNLASETKLPLFLHCRNAFEDLISGIQKHIEQCGPIHGVVHTFDGTEEQAKAIIELGFHIGFNGCSLKTERNLEVVASVPSEKILLETDAPWCEIRPTHAGFQHVVTKFAKNKPNKWESGRMVAGRNEPANIVQVLEVVAGARGQLPDDLAYAAYENTLRVFPGLLAR